MAAFAWFYAYAWRALLPALLIAAWRWGGRPEKIAATMYAFAAFCSVFVWPAWGAHPFVSVEWAMLGIDCGLAAGLVWLALTADRYWPLPSVAFQVLSCLGHIEKMIDPAGQAMGYQLMAESSIYPTLVLLGAGIWRQHRRNRARLPYRDFFAPQV